ncbi:unnamed product [Ostreococcus tauri]|uniref:Unnamed product n=1 Tax=Ostreococcus tauri TaxID=70448 RepID=A0A096PAF1_OSTTA|nr:unnamed product [Ostreococcus tauri]CEG01287.1 unnamed product [Ostreococcus tauri]|eukprot:XP_022840875.1 unnamed product [Ostreococcus tauri]
MSARSSRTLAERVVRAQFGVVTDKAHDPLGIWAQGEALCELVWHAFALLAMTLYTAENVSLCGHLEVVPNALATLYFIGITACAHSALWGAMMGARAESVRALKAARALAGAVPALALVGLSVFPRCMWHPHQEFVVLWSNATALAMLFELAVDSKYVSRRFRGGTAVTSSGQALAQVAFFVGYLITIKYYSVNGFAFFRGEFLGSASYGWWCFSKHRAGTFPNQTAARTYTWRELFVLDGCIGVLFLTAYRYNEYKGCDKFGNV